MRWLTILGFVLFLAAGVLVAQSSQGTITGRITDPTKAVVVDAKVTLTNVDTGIAVTAITDQIGAYHFAAVSAGNYRMQVEKAGFATVIRPKIVVHVQDALELNFEMAVGGVSESVTVEAGTPLVNTESATVSTVVDRKFVDSIPLNGRTVQALMTLTPGVVPTRSTWDESGQFSVNGQRTDTNYYTVDGVSANVGITGTLMQRESAGSVPGFSAVGTTSNLVSLDAMQEFRIQTSTFAPEYGRSPGAQISMVTRSGTNQLHGSVSEYLRNDVLDANNWFANQNALPKAKERQNFFGGTLGGALVKNRTFFFFSYEGLRLRQPVTRTTLVPDVASRSAAPAALQPLLKAFPLPTGTATPDQAAQGIAPANATVSNPSTLNATSLRLDHKLSDKVSLFARYNYAPSSVVAQGSCCAGYGEPLNYFSTSAVKTQTATAGSTQILSPRIANEFLFNYSRFSSGGTSSLSDYGGAVVPTPEQMVPASEGVTLPKTWAYEFLILGMGAFDTGVGQVANIQRQLNFVDNFSWTKGAHHLRFGVDYRQMTPRTNPPEYLQIPVFCGVTACAMMGGGPTFSVVSGIGLEAVVISDDPVALRYNNYSLYAQDAWNVSPRLTLTYGLRWEINPPPSALDGKHLVRFVDPYAADNLTLAPQGTPLYETGFRNFAPRVGVAYVMRQKTGWDTVLRGGWGMFYDLGNSQTGSMASTFPFMRQGWTIPAPFPFTPEIAAPIPFKLTPPYGQLATTDPNLVLPRTYQWNFSAEQSLGADQKLTLSYVGAIGRRLTRNVTLYPSSAANGEMIYTNGATSDYHGLQTQFQRRLSQGVQALVSYSWSHSIDTQSFNSGGTTAPTGTYNAQLQRGSSDFDIRHALTGAIVYDVPKAPGFLGRTLLRDWAIDTNIVARSATPIDITWGNLPGPGGSSISQHPNRVAGQPFYLHQETYNGLSVPGGVILNEAAFSAPPSGQDGDLGRNALRGFGAWQVDLALRREFKITERVGTRFQAEFFNLFNHPNFANFNSNLSSSSFGVARSMVSDALGGLSAMYQFGGPRSVQLGLKLSF